MHAAPDGLGPLFLWAVDVSKWNAPPHTRVAARGGGSTHAKTREETLFEHDVDTLVQRYSAPETAKVRQYLRQVDRARSLVARLLPRVFFARHGARWGDVQVHAANGGRPRLVRPAAVAETYDFNISHDGDWVVLAVYGMPRVRVGVDVMEVELPPYEESAASFCDTMEFALTPHEARWVADACSDADRISRLMDVWTYKEAYTKNIGEGLGFDFRSVELAFWSTDPAALLRVHGHRVCDFQFVQVSLPPGETRSSRPSRAAVAVGPLPPQTSCSRVSLSAADAASQGWLTRWTYDAFLQAARSAEGTG
ncbi:hypothetical protein MSPP1_001067 [Malassezia sp. CBS 17886]|nr:hypothetical protein MSPP1_001067 [Malassezia sp. CBS 17886]